MKVTSKEWCTMSDHNKQILLNAVAKKYKPQKGIDDYATTNTTHIRKSGARK